MLVVMAAELCHYNKQRSRQCHYVLADVPSAAAERDRLSLSSAALARN